MPRVNVPVVQVLRTGILNAGSGVSEVAGDATNNHYFINDERIFIQARNNGATPRTVTLIVAQTVDGQAVTNPTVAIAATSAKVIGPFPNSVYKQPGDTAEVWFNVDHADLKLMALRL